jgi:hypothetical protein
MLKNCGAGGAKYKGETTFRDHTPYSIRADVEGVEVVAASDV